MDRTFIGIDPGFSGAIAVWAAGNITVIDMPVRRFSGTERQIDITKISRFLQEWGASANAVVGLEWNSARPEQASQASYRFGYQTGAIMAILELGNFQHICIAPNKWKGDLGLPGKTIDPKSKRAAEWLLLIEPSYDKILFGPKGGLLDGRVDALCIMHWLMEQYDKR
jgi:hypothetical protein